jgi:hypothetical protein
MGMLKTAVNKVAGKTQPEAYPLGYVEDCVEPRTQFTVVFSIPWVVVHDA